MMNAPRLSLTTLALVVAGHLAAFAALASWRGVPLSVTAPVMIVDVISEAPKRAQVSVPAPVPVPPKALPASRPERPRPSPAPPVLAAAGVATPEMAEVAKPAVSPPVQAAPVIAAASAAVTTPRFDADYLDNPAPTYPPLSRRVGEEGKVVLRVFVEPTGLPAKVEIRTSSGYERLDKSAAAAVGRWKFIPARQGSDTVGAWVLVPIVFSLKA